MNLGNPEILNSKSATSVGTNSPYKLYILSYTNNIDTSPYDRAIKVTDCWKQAPKHGIIGSSGLCPFSLFLSIDQFYCTTCSKQVILLTIYAISYI